MALLSINKPTLIKHNDCVLAMFGIQFFLYFSKHQGETSRRDDPATPGEHLLGCQGNRRCDPGIDVRGGGGRAIQRSLSPEILATHEGVGCEQTANVLTSRMDH